VSARAAAARRGGLSPEDRLCLLLARGTFPPAVRAESLELLRAPLRWDLILDRVTAHAVFPLVSRNLDALDFEGVPQAARESLTVLSRLNAFRNVLLLEDLRHALQALGGAGVPVIPLKGVALAASLYGDAALRVCSDLDVLVPPRDVARAFDLLLADGYEPWEPYDVDGAEIDWLLSSNIEYGFLRRRREFAAILELHWDMAWRWQPEGRVVERAWRRAEPCEVLGAKAWRLSPEWEALYLMVHAARHRWHGLKWAVDIHELCVRGDVPWNALRETAAAFGWAGAVQVSLSVCETLFDTPVPERWAGRRVPGWVPLFPAAPPPADIWSDALVPVRLLDGPGARLRYLLRLLLLPTLAERRALCLPTALRALYYPLRPVRLAARWTRDAAGMGIRQAANVARRA
jgi:hypothetical protein